MLRLPLTSALAATFLLTVSLNSSNAQNLKTPANQPQPIQTQFGKVANPSPTREGGIEGEDDGGLELKTAVGFERWLPEAPPNPHFSPSVIENGRSFVIKLLEQTT